MRFSAQGAILRLQELPRRVPDSPISYVRCEIGGLLFSRLITGSLMSKRVVGGEKFSPLISHSSSKPFDRTNAHDINMKFGSAYPRVKTIRKHDEKTEKLGGGLSRPRPCR